MFWIKILIIGVFAFSFSLLSISILKPDLKSVTSEKLKDPYVEYTLNPTPNKFYFNVDLFTPVITQKPSSITYIASLLKERREYKKGKSGALFLAKKRINELYKFNKEMEVLHNYNGIDELRRWISEIELSPITMFLRRKDYLTWEAALGQYTSLIESEANSINRLRQNERNERLMILKNNVLRYRDILSRTIISLNKPDADKTYLFKLNNDTSNYLITKTIGKLPEIKTLDAEYRLGQIYNDLEFGKYKFQLKKDLPRTYIPNKATLWLNGTTIPVSNINYSTVYFQETVVDNTAQKVLLEVPPLNLAQNSSWTKQKKSGEEDYFYQDISLLSGVNKYIIKFQQKNDFPVIFQLLLINKKINSLTGAVTKSFYTYSNEIVLKTESLDQFEHFVEFVPERRFDEIRIQVTRKEPGSSLFSTPSNVKVIPIAEPKIDMFRTSYIDKSTPSVKYDKFSPYHYQVDIQNPTMNTYRLVKNSLGVKWLMLNTEKNDGSWKYNIYYWPFFLLPLLILSLSAILVLNLYFRYRRPTLLSKKNLYSFFKNTNTLCRKIKHILLNSSNFILAFFSLLRLPFFIIAVSGFILYIISGKITESFPAYLILSWVLSLLSYRQNLNTSTKLGFILLVLVPLLLIFGAEQLAERVAITAYLLSFTGVVLSLVQRKMPISATLTAGSFSALLKNDVLNLICKFPSPIPNMTLSIYHRLKKIFLELYGPFPVTERNKIPLLTKSMITGYFLFSLIFAFQSYQTIISRLALNPSISKYEPRLAYRSTKILIRGDGFGWREKEHVRLLNGNREVYVDYWSPTKIIFTVPLHWEYKPQPVWIEKSAIWKGKRITVKSDVMTLKIIPATANFGPEDDLFFEQLKKFEDETLEINGYSKNK